MIGRIRGALLAAAVAFLGFVSIAPAARADLIAYDISWTGSADYTMTGEFSFDDASGGDGRIDESEVLTLLIEGFHNGVSIGSWNLADGISPGAIAFNFNFDPVAEVFFVGALSGGPNGQNWNAGNSGASGFGFSSGSVSQGFTINGTYVLAAILPVANSTLIATRQILTIPEPTTIALFGAGLVGLGLLGRRRKAA